MKKSAASVLAVAAVAAAPALGIAGQAFAATTTHTSIVSSSVSGDPSRENAVIVVSSGNDNSEVVSAPVRVKYFKKVDGAWKKVDAKTVKTGGLGVAYVKFVPVAKGTCKLTARYAGTDKYAGSRDAAVIDCASGMLKH